MIYEKIYEKLTEIVGNIEKLPEAMTLKSNGFMDLHVERLERSIHTSYQEHYYLTISLTHYYKQNGDLVPDPDMTVRIYPENKAAEALNYQDSFDYQEVYPEPGKVDIKAKKELNAFLSMWLSNLKAQGFNRNAAVIKE